MNYFSKLLGFLGTVLLFFCEANGHDCYKQIATLTPILPGIDILGDSFGEVLFATDDFIFVGAPVTTVNGKKISGAVYVYKKKEHSDKWVRIQIITTGGLLDHLSALKIYANKKWLFVAAIGTPIGPIANDIPSNQNFTGSILIYKWSENRGQWVFSQSLDRNTPGLEDLTVAAPGAVSIPPVPFLLVENGATFGTSFDVNWDKGLLLVGAPGQIKDSVNDPAINAGAVYAFRLHGHRWKLFQKLTNPDEQSEDDSFGGQVVIYKKYALISNSFLTTPHININSSVYLYHFENGQWNYIQKVEGDKASNTLVEMGVFAGTTPFLLSPNFGASIAADKGWVIIGAPYENLGTNQLKGAVYFYQFTRNEGTKALVRRQKFVSDDPNTLFTGIAVAMDDKTAAAGDPGHTGPHGEQAQGGLLVFRRKDNQWIREMVLFDKEGFPFQLFGNGVAIKDKFIIGGVGDAVLGEVIMTAVPPLLPLPTPLAQNRVVIWKRR